jgi:hypothetical protein
MSGTTNPIIQKSFIIYITKDNTTWQMALVYATALD